MDPHGPAALGVEPAVEGFVGGEVLEFQLADPLHHHSVLGPHAGEPARIDILGRRLVAPGGTGNGIDERLTAALRGEVDQPHGGLHLPAREPPGRLTFDAERAHIGKPDHAVCREQIANQAVDLLDHRIAVHRLCFFSGLAAALFAAGFFVAAGEDCTVTSGRE